MREINHTLNMATKTADDAKQANVATGRDDLDHLDELETQEWIDALEYVLSEQGPDRARHLLEEIIEAARVAGVDVPFTANTAYVNTIPAHLEPDYPGDREMERRIKSVVRWNAMAMVVKANTRTDEHGNKVAGIGGHISTYASAATLYEVAYNHFFRGRKGEFPGDQIFFQGHASPGMYARAYVEGVLPASKLHNFRRELAEGGGLSSYPHPWLMPNFWQFPTVSMGLGPINSIYQARFNRYLVDRGIIPDHGVRTWAFLGDGECDEPETLGAISLASRENLDNLTWVINCNLQRLDGPVRGNFKIIQELEAIFRGAGWNVVKVVWGSNWDKLLAKDKKGILKKRMMEVIDGEYQKFSVEGGAYNREHFFGKYPELKEMVADMTDEEIRDLRRGGLDPQKVFAAYNAAVSSNNGKPTVILAKTVKGYGLGELGEGRNIAHNQKGDKVQQDELVAFRDRFHIPVPDDEIHDLPFYRFPKNSPEQQYLEARRKELGGFLPNRVDEAAPINVPGMDFFRPMIEKFTGHMASTTGTFAGAILPALLRHKEFGKFVVPIIPDEARTFGMDSLFAQVGIYSHVGQLYEPVDRKMIAYYKEATNGQILEEGITEAGAMASFIAAGTAYATHGVQMMPFYTYYSQFGFQRVGDLCWLAGDIRARGFLLGGTAGRTTLNGEGLQHQDGHSPLLANTIPNCLVYHPAYGFEIAVIIQDGMKRMFQEHEDVFYYITLGNENYEQHAMPEGVEEGILKGLYKFRASEGKGLKAHIFADFSAINAALDAQKILEKDYGVSADVWSATSYKQLRYDCMEAERWNALHPTAKKKKTSYLQDVLAREEGPFIAVSDQMRLVAQQIDRWVPGGLFTLGTDGYGRSESREDLRRFFETDAQHTVVAVLGQLAEAGKIKPTVVEKAIKALEINPEQEFSLYR